MIFITEEERRHQYSFSRLNCYCTCPYSYYLRYIKDCPEENNAFSDYGTFVHSILEKYFNKDLELFELAGYYEDNFDDAVKVDFPPNAYCDLGERYYEDGLNFFESFEGLEGYEVLGVELEFTVPLYDNYKFHGFIDLLLRDPSGKIVILDHKSKKKFKNKQEQAHYAIQLILYGLYVKEHYGVWPDRVVFNMFRSQNFVKIKFSEEALAEAIEWARGIITAIESEKDWQAKPDDFFCNELCSSRACCDRKNAKI